jgi:dynein assembly factor 3
MKELFDLSELKYKEIDELVEIFYSWSSKTSFNIEKYRDDRLRYHYKTRYDYRLNLIDWDY